MKTSILSLVIVITTAILGAGADPECEQRKLKGLSSHWPNPSDCSHFYRCTDNVKREIVCSRGKVYNRKTGRCSKRGKGMCRLSLIAPLTTNDNICNKKLSGTYLAKEGFCRDFYICNDNKAYQQSCSGRSYFSSQTGNCVPDSNKTCWQNKCVGVTDSTYLGDEKSCLSFYICKANDATKQTCDSGSYFDRSSNNCIPDKNNTHCWENYCLDRTDGDFVANDEDSRNYYVCVDHKPVAQECPAGSIFNKNSLICQSTETSTPEAETSTPEAETSTPEAETSTPEAETSTPEAETSTPEAETSTPEAETSTPEAETSTPEAVTSTPEAETRTPDVTTDTTTETCIESTTETSTVITTDSGCTCVGGYNEGDMVPHPTSCNLFYICYAGELVEQSCQPENYFNVELGACERVVDAASTNVKTRSARSVGKSSGELIVAKANPNVATCLGIYHEGELIPDANDCQQFSVCLGGVLVRKQCGIGRYFDARGSICQIDAGTCKQGRNSNSTLVAMTTDDQTDKSCTCPGGYSSGDIVPHPTDCDKFYVCFDSALQESECGVGHRFDASNSTCVADIDGSCWPATEKNCSCPGGYEPGQMTPHPNNCRLYFVCFDGKLVESDCSDGNRFDVDAQACVVDNCGTCSSDPGDVCRNKPNNVLLPNTTHCYSFSQCMNGVAVPGTCSASDWFDPATGFCVLDVDANCRNPCENVKGITLLPHPDCTKFYVCNDGKATVGKCDNGKGFNQQQQQCLTGCCDNVCADKSDGTTFPIPNDPNSFYYCLNGIQVRRNCERDTAYDATLGICMLQPSCDCDQKYCVAGSANDGKIAAPTRGDNTEFCVCRNGAAYKESCPTGYEFDKKKNICYSNAPCDPLKCMQSSDYTPFVNRNNTHSFCMCVTNVAVIVQCPKGGTFDPKKLLCVQPPPQDSQCDPNRCLKASPYTAFPSLTCDKSSFCVCVDGGAKLKKCPSDYVFSEVLGICVAADNSCDSTYCMNPENAYSVFPMQGNQHAFCYCDKEKAVSRACGNGTIFNEVIKACLAEVNDCDISLCANASSSNAYPTPARNDPQHFCYCSSPVTVTKFSCTEGKLFDAKKGICLDHAMCEGNYYQYQSIGNPDACNKYFMCFNGKMLDLTCGENLYYDSAAMHCLPNDNGQCKITGSSICTCPGGYQEGQLLPHPTDCHKFYICADSVLHEADCGETNYFNETQALCMHDTAGVCQVPATDCTCVGNYREGDLVAEPNDPQRFYVCSNAKLVSQDCGNGNVFDSQLMHCVPRDSRSQMIRSKTITKRSTPKLVHEGICAEGQKQSVPANCSQYETCMNGQWVRLTCSSQFYYNPEEKQCLEPRDDTVCTYARVSGLPVCDDEHEGQLAPSRSQLCASYLSCSHGKWRHQLCPEKKLFSASLHTCISTSDNSICQETKSPVALNAAGAAVTCVHTQVRASERNCATYFMCLEDEWWIQHCPLGTYFNRTLNYCVPNDASQCESAEPLEANQLIQSSCQREGALRASTLSCEHFYVCAAGIWFPQKCDSHQYFNVTQQACVSMDGTCASFGKTHCKPGHLRSLPHSCSAYSRCSDDGNEWVRFECSKEHFFDDLFNACVLNDGSCASSGLLRACREGEVKPHPQNEKCNEFLQCSASGEWQISTCLKGYTYVHEVRSCRLSDGLDRCEYNAANEEKVSEVTTTVEPKHRICSGVADGSAVRHSSDCSKFYICQNGLPGLVQSCSSGSFFDAALSYCRPNDGSCRLLLTGPCEHQKGRAFVPNPDDCTSYYECFTLNGTVLHQCAEGEFYHNDTNQCRRDHGECRTELTSSICATQPHGARVPHETHCNLYYACVRGLATMVACPVDHKYDELKYRCVPDLEKSCKPGALAHSNSKLSCRGRGSNSSHIVDRSDCTRYYDCNSGEAQHKQCEAGRYFDPLLLQCLPDDGSCPLVGANQNHQQALSPNPNACRGRHGNLMPDPGNCNEFYVCINGKLRHERCYADHFFNATIMQCQTLVRSGNSSQVFSDAYTSTTNITQTDAQVQCSDPPTNFTQLCGQLEVGGSMAEQGDCRRYITCEEGKSVSQRCRNGESYDSLLGLCRQNDGTCLLENGQRVGLCKGKHGQLARDVENCRGFFVCINGQKITSECSEGQYFSKSKNMCQFDELKQCVAKVQTEDNSVVPALKRNPEQKLCANALTGQRYANHENKCRSFYVCLSTDTLQHIHCPSGTLFDMETSICRSAELVSCKET